MAGEWKCRHCRTEIGGAAHLRLGPGVSGASALCLVCTDKLRNGSHAKLIQEFVVEYKREQQPKSEAMRLRQENDELRRIINALRDKRIDR